MTRTSKKLVPTTTAADMDAFAHKVDEVVALHSTLNTTWHALQEDLIAFSVSFTKLVEEGKRIDKATKSKDCHARLIAQFGSNYSDKSIRSRYKKIASMAHVFSKPHILKALPSGGRDTLYSLARVDESTIESWVETNAINPDMSQRETKALVSDALPARSSKRNAQVSAPITDSVIVTMYFKDVASAASALQMPVSAQTLLTWDCKVAKDKDAIEQLLSRNDLRARHAA